jgi:hypothetical protein
MYGLGCAASKRTVQTKRSPGQKRPGLHPPNTLDTQRVRIGEAPSRFRRQCISINKSKHASPVALFASSSVNLA